MKNLLVKGLGVRLCHRLGIATSRMSILRRVMKLAAPYSGTVTCLGIDDFAFRRGRTFGTVLVDLERHEVVDLLPDRQAQTAASWMQKHPEIKYVSRDRGSEYRAAAEQRPEHRKRFKSQIATISSKT